MKTKSNSVITATIENSNESKWTKPLALLGKILLFLVGIVLSLKAIKEPDLWWQLATGDWILTNKTIPVSDVFSFTYLGTKWINIKWGFEVLISLCTKAFGFEFIYVIQALVTIALLYFILKLVNFKNKHFLDKTWANSLILLCSFVFLAASSNRIIGRPEMFSHLFSIIFIYLLTRFQNQKNLIYLLPIFQLIWTNMHEAFGTGIVIISIFVFAAWVSNRTLPASFVEAFDEANAMGLQHLEEIVAAHPFPEYNLLQYYQKNIHYELDENKRKGLDLFLKMISADHG